MKLTQEDGTDATLRDVMLWLAARDETGSCDELAQISEQMSGAFLTCGERCGLERFINYLVKVVGEVTSQVPVSETRFPWQQHGPSELRTSLFEQYLTTAFISSDRGHIPAALEKIGSSRALTHEERSGYPY